MIDWEDEYEDQDREWGELPLENRELFEPTDEEEYSFEGEEDFDDSVLDIDYSMFKGDFNDSMKTIKHKIKRKKKKKKKPLTKFIDVQKDQHALIYGGRKQLHKVIVPNDRDVIVEGVEQFIMSKDSDIVKNIGYYKGEKLKELIININNTNGTDFTIELFNPSDPLDYLHSTAGNLNDRISVAPGSRTSYSDLLFNILANPTIIPNARFIATGSNVAAQKRERLGFINKDISGESSIAPIQLSLNQDLYQYQNDVILFDIQSGLNRLFLPDGMDIIQYTVLAGMNVTFCFYYKQKSLKKYFWPEARKKKMVMGDLRGIL